MPETKKDQLERTDTVNLDETVGGDWILAVNGVREVRDRLTGFVGRIEVEDKK